MSRHEEARRWAVAQAGAAARLDPTGSRTYAETVARGLYGRPDHGLFGKHDNVRLYWEDELTRSVLRPAMRRRAEAARVGRRGLRVLDLGCGAGQGYELLTTIRDDHLSLDDAPPYVLQGDDVSAYLGLDLSESMVHQGRRNYRDRPHVRFQVADLRAGLGPARAEAPFDVYFSSYGALSHLDGPGLQRCLAELARHGRPGALVVLDLLGRWSPEWPQYWGARTEAEKLRPYSMSYLYSPDERASDAVERFPLRFWIGAEVRELCAAIERDVGVPLRVLELCDRSLFVGRHVETDEYGTCVSPMRGVVNQLYEPNVRTRMDTLRVAYRSVAGAEELNRFFLRLASCWNEVVDLTHERLSGEGRPLVDRAGWRSFPVPLQQALMTMDRTVDSVAWIEMGDVRANVIEPQLADVLRRMQYQLQEGRGCGHGLLAILELGAPRDG